MGRYDYDDESFYKQVERLASGGLSDAEIAKSLGFTRDYFAQMKNGRLPSWTDEQRERRGEALRRALQEGRLSVTAALRATYLNTALGKVVTRQKSVRRQAMPCECGGGDPDCPDCHGTGRVMVVTGEQEAEVQQPPNLQALTTLLEAYAPDWRQAYTPEETEAESGINIEQWIEKEMSVRTDDGDEIKDGEDDKDA